jgi:MoaA/NifB/PqqE/SkfB family radical SAM enzyme
MIDTLCPVEWSGADNAAYRILTPRFELPVEFKYFAEPGYRDKVVNLKSCPCCRGDAVPLLVNWVYQSPKIILLDSPVTYCLKTATLLLTKSDGELLRTRQLQIGRGQRVPLQSRFVGVGERIVEPLVSLRVLEALGLNSQSVADFSLEADAIVYERPEDTEPEALPHAIAFHSNTRPEQITLAVEATTRCNYRCGFCYGRHIDQGSLSLDSFLTMLDRFPNLQAVDFTGEGEPLMNRHLLDMVRICVDRGLWTHVSSNGSLLNDATCERLVLAGPSSIAVSMESIDPVQFARLRPGGKLETVLNSIRTIVRLRKEHGLSFQLRLWVSILRETLSQVDKIEEFAKETGVDLVEFQVLNPLEAYSRFYDDEMLKNMLTPAEMEDLIRHPDTTPALRSALASVAAVYRGRSCHVFMSEVIAFWQGNVTPCRLLKTPQFTPYGNLASDSFEDIWNREEYQFFRFALQHGVILPSCKGCPVVGSA